MPSSGSSYSKNIALPPRFSDRLRLLREAQNLSKTDLADKAGTTYRTIQNLETNRHQRAQEKTLMGLAEALEISYTELMAPPTAEEAIEPTSASPKPQRLLLAAAFGLILLTAGAWSAWSFATQNAEWALVDSELHCRDAIFGTKLWSLSKDALIARCEVAPWDESILIIGLSNGDIDGGSALAIDRATGRQLWQCQPDLNQLTRAMGEDIMSDANMGCNTLMFCDIDGDGQKEILTKLSHGLYHPTALCLISQDGTLLKQYAHKGHLADVVVLDYDNDGKDEIITSGVSNAARLGGPSLVILDEDHWSGASIDSLTNPWSSEPDSSLYRVSLPSFPAPYQALLEDGRLSGHDLKLLEQPDGRNFISVLARGNAHPTLTMWILFDDQLRPIKTSPGDAFKDEMAWNWPDSLTNGTGPADAAWCEAWLGQAVYSGAGR